MRPRLITAENERERSAAGRPTSSFNEAAAHHRGELRHLYGEQIFDAVLQ